MQIVHRMTPDYDTEPTYDLRTLGTNSISNSGSVMAALESRSSSGGEKILDVQVRKKETPGAEDSYNVGVTNH